MTLQILLLKTYIIEYITLAVVTTIPFVLIVAFFTLAERKILASVQRRHGPKVVGLWGTLQAIADGVKLILKESTIPSKSNKFLFVLAPILSFTLSFSTWSLIPFDYQSSVFDFEYGLLVVFIISSLNVYSLILAGWSSNSKYAFIGSLRAVAQMISYEVSFVFCVFSVILLTGSLNLIDIVQKQENGFFLFPLFPIAVIFFVTILAETNRAPFDLPEAEAEIVAGYNVEYSGILFVLFFLSEYCSMVVMSTLWVLLFWGGWLPFFDIFSIFFSSYFIFSFKVMIIAFLYVFVRANFPRYRYDQLMSIGWRVFLLLSTGYFLFLAGLLFNFRQSRPFTAVDYHPEYSNYLRKIFLGFTRPENFNLIDQSDFHILLSKKIKKFDLTYSDLTKFVQSAGDDFYRSRLLIKLWSLLDSDRYKYYVESGTTFLEYMRLRDINPTANTGVRLDSTVDQARILDDAYRISIHEWATGFKRQQHKAKLAEYYNDFDNWRKLIYMEYEIGFLHYPFLLGPTIPQLQKNWKANAYFVEDVKEFWVVPVNYSFTLKNVY